MTHSHDDDIARRDRETRDRDATRATEEMRAAERDREIAQLEDQLQDHNPESVWYQGSTADMLRARAAAEKAADPHTVPAPTGLPPAPTVTARCRKCGARWRAGMQQCQVCQGADWWIED